MSEHDEEGVRWIACLKPGQDFDQAKQKLPMAPLKVLGRIKTVFLPELTDEQVESLKADGWAVSRNQQRQMI
jgi:hypothetical protein